MKQIRGCPPSPDGRTLSQSRGRDQGRSRGEGHQLRGVGGPVDFDAKGDLTAALYNVYSYKDGKQDVVRTLRIRK